jgi:replicative DNA helicase
MIDIGILSSPDIERTLLSSMLAYTEAYHQAIALGVSAEYFSSNGHQQIFRAMCKVGERGDPVQGDTLFAELLAVGLGEHFSGLLKDVADPLNLPRKNVEWHVQQLADKARRRGLVTACECVIRAAEDRGETTDDCMGRLDDALLQLRADANKAGAVSLKDIMPSVLAGLERCAAGAGLIGMPTGVSSLDEATTGIRLGEFWVVGALPGRGKTVMGAQMALANARAGTPVAFFSLEMGREELGSRLLSNESSVSASRIRDSRYIAKAQWGDLKACASRLSEWPLYVDDSATLNIHELAARARLYIRRFGCRLIVVDYLRLVTAPGKELRERVANVADALRQLAKRERVGVVALSQLSRPKDRDINGKPTMLDLKESGDIEAHANVVLLLYMPIENHEPTGKDEIILGKNRHGALGPLEVTFDRARLKFMPRYTELGRETQSARGQFKEQPQ